MNTFRNMLQEFLSQRPGVGIFASLGGFGTSLLSLLEHASVIVGAAGALFGLLAGYHTWQASKIKRRRLEAHDANTCILCRTGKPVECPYLPRFRPADCPFPNKVSPQ